MSTSREYTPEEVRELFLSAVALMVKRTLEVPDEKLPDGTIDPTEWRVQHVAFCILSLLDGGTRAPVGGGRKVSFPGFLVAPRPHAEDRAYHEKRGEPWFPNNDAVAERIAADIAGRLHDDFFAVYASVRGGARA
jgi:hypothetical protein